MLTHDGYGPMPANCYEEYVCAFGPPGDYHLRVRRAWGKIVGDRAGQVAGGLGAMIDGVYIREALKQAAPDGEGAVATALTYLSLELEPRA